MKAIVGLGNPGKKYEGTRHNVGFECLRRLARKWSAGRAQNKYNAEWVEVSVGGEKILLVSPLTYMNLSGDAVKPIADFFRLPLSELLIICDDLALPPGKIRLRASGSCGGQKGLRHICQRFGSEDVPRLRIGIGATPPNWETSDYVLSRFSADEQVLMDQVFDRAADAATCWVQDGIVLAMNRFNADPSPAKPDRQDRPS